MNVYELRKSGGWNAILDAEILEHTCPSVDFALQTTVQTCFI